MECPEVDELSTRTVPSTSSPVRSSKVAFKCFTRTNLWHLQLVISPSFFLHLLLFFSALSTEFFVWYVFLISFCVFQGQNYKKIIHNTVKLSQVLICNMFGNKLQYQLSTRQDIICLHQTLIFFFLKSSLQRMPDPSWLSLSKTGLGNLTAVDIMQGGGRV